MRRAKRKRPEFKLSLFAFLDSQLCVLGALILLLVVVSTANLRTPDPDPDAPKPEQVAADREMLELRLAQLTEQREKTQEDLRRRQLELGHLEADALKLRQTLEQIVNFNSDLNSQVLTAAVRSQLEFQVAHTQAEIARKRLMLDQMRQKLAQGSRSFAVVPYEGPNGTRRQPIYIECQANAILLQPEGIALTETDFEGPLGPGNPLAAAIRAAREHMARQRRSSTGETGEPYPFLLVRPDGIDAYWVAREALQSWSSDFGYELVDAEWKLAYEPPDDVLKTQVTQAIEVAREQQRLLAQMAPRTLGSNKRVFRANPSGGGVVADHGSGRGSEGRYAGRPRGSGGFGSGNRPSGPYGNSSAGSGLGSGTGTDDGLMPEEAPLDRIGGSRMAGGTGPDGGFSEGEAGEEGFGGSAGGEESFGDETGGSGDAMIARGAGSRSEGGTGDPGQFGGEQGRSEQGQGEVGRPGGPHSQGQYAQGGEADARFGQSRPGMSRVRAGSAGGGSASPGAGGSPGGSNGASAAGASAPGASAHAVSMAQSRGENWGVPQGARGSSAVIRPVLLQCRGDAIGIVSSSGSGRVERWISFQGETEGSVDPLLDSVWKHIDGWGIAGQGLYWHPTLVLDVQPGGDGRATDLEVLLAGSGIDVKRRQAGRIATAPTTSR